MAPHAKVHTESALLSGICLSFSEVVQHIQAKEYNTKGSITFHILAEHGKHGLIVCGHFQQGPAAHEPN